MPASSSILRKSFSPSLVPEMSSPESVTIRSRTPGEEAVAFTTEDGDVMPNPPSTVLKMMTVLQKGSSRSQIHNRQ